MFPEQEAEAERVSGGCSGGVCGGLEGEADKPGTGSEAECARGRLLPRSKLVEDEFDECADALEKVCAYTESGGRERLSSVEHRSERRGGDLRCPPFFDEGSEGTACHATAWSLCIYSERHSSTKVDRTVPTQVNNS